LIYTNIKPIFIRKITSFHIDVSIVLRGNVGWLTRLNNEPSERWCWEGKRFEFNHKIMIKVQESPPSIKVPRKLIVCKSLSK